MEGTPHHATYYIHMLLHRYAQITVNHFKSNLESTESFKCNQTPMTYEFIPAAL